MTRDIFEAIGVAVLKARKHHPYGLYDYSSYPGEKPPHQVTNDEERVVLLASEDAQEAEREFDALVNAHVGKAAVEAVEAFLGASTEPDEFATSKARADLGADLYEQTGTDWRFAIDGNLTEPVACVVSLMPDDESLPEVKGYFGSKDPMMSLKLAIDYLRRQLASRE